jgi:hypothetical protein
MQRIHLTSALISGASARPVGGGRALAPPVDGGFDVGDVDGGHGACAVWPMTADRAQARIRRVAS